MHECTHEPQAFDRAEVWRSAGPKFLAMLSGGDPSSAVLDPSWFRERVRKQLTKLSLVLYPGKGHGLENVGMLTALQRLELHSMDCCWCGLVHSNLAGQKLDLKLPHLVSLCLTDLGMESLS